MLIHDSFSITFTIKGNVYQEEIPPCHFLALLTPFPVITFINKKATGFINKEAIDAIVQASIGAIIAERNPPSCFFIRCFTVSLALSINRPDFSTDSTILRISSISFEMKKVNSLHALTAPCPVTFRPSLSIAFVATFEVILLTYPGKHLQSREQQASLLHL